jgi:hypothetical protein
MYNEQIDNLINLALADGELTEKEKQILFKKAEEAGIDLDEFEMVLDARLYESQKLHNAENVAAAAAAPAATPKSDKFGDIKKCPACGSIIQSFTAICADCGHTFSSVNAVSSVTRLYEQLQLIESEERNRKVDNGWIGRLQGGHSADPQLEERIKKRKASVVQGFPVPNTKEDILEFLAMAVPEASKKPNFMLMMTGAGALYKAWHGKAEQVVIKARFSLKEDKRLLEEINHYAQQLGIK